MVLQGLRVLDFGRYAAGPYCAALLAEFGADVIRVDKRGGSEDRFLTPLAETGEGALFLQLNRNKRSITLDPMSEGGRDLVRRLVATADVVVANLPRPTLLAMGLDYDSLRAVKRDIILVNISTFGDVGPWGERPGFDSIGQAMCGSAYMSGRPDQPSRAQVNWVDYGTGAHGAFGAVLALMDRQRTGEGQEVKAALLSTALTFNNPPLIEQALTGVNRKPVGNRSPTSAPTDMFATRDGWIVTHVIGQPLFRRWARLMGEEHWLQDPRFKDDSARGDNSAPICERMAHWCAERTRDQALDELAASGVPAGPVLSPQETLDHPQVRAMEALQLLDFPGLPSPAPVARMPVDLSRTPGAIRARPPKLGEHTRELLEELGCSEADISRLQGASVI